MTESKPHFDHLDHDHRDQIYLFVHQKLKQVVLILVKYLGVYRYMVHPVGTFAPNIWSIP
jgi:hypothetical protein